MLIRNGEERGGRNDNFIILFYNIDLELSCFYETERKGVGARTILLYCFTE